MQGHLAKHAQKFRFLLVGISLTVLDFGLLFLFVHLRIDKIPANYLSTGISFIASFIVNRSYTFKATNGHKIKQFSLFIIVTIVALWVLQPIIISFITAVPVVKALTPSLGLFIAKLLATAVSLTWNYTFYSTVVFRKDKASLPVPL